MEKAMTKPLITRIQAMPQWTTYTPFDSNTPHLPQQQLPNPHKIIQNYLKSITLDPQDKDKHTKIPTATPQTIKTSDYKIYQHMAEQKSP
jgi:hypothetical protein